MALIIVLTITITNVIVIMMTIVFSLTFMISVVTLMGNFLSKTTQDKQAGNYACMYMNVQLYIHRNMYTYVCIYMLYIYIYTN